MDLWWSQAKSNHKHVSHVAIDMDLSHEDAKQVKNGYQGKMKIKKITPPFVAKGKQKNRDQAIEENWLPNCKLYTIVLRF